MDGDGAKGEPLARFELDVVADRQASVLRGMAAAVVLLAGLWALLLPFTVPRLTALIGVAFGVLWLKRAAELRRRAQRPEEHFLELWPDRFVQGEPGPGTTAGPIVERQLTLDWSEIAGIELDEDALVLRLHTTDGNRVEIEPDYHGIDVYDLRDAVAEAWSAAREAEVPE